MIIKKHKTVDLTVGQLRKELEGMDENLPVFLEHVSERTFYTNGFYAASLPCDTNAVCSAHSSTGEKYCADCHSARNYSYAFAVIKTDEALYIDSTY